MKFRTALRRSTVIVIILAALAFAIACSEMFTTAKHLASSNKSMVPYVAAAVFYYVFNFLVALLMEWWERRFSYYR